ncbi:MAG TPA: hypothetical protein VGC88_12495 [Terriglobales bacterium]|jgi:hypothetical protein
MTKQMLAFALIACAPVAFAQKGSRPGGGGVTPGRSTGVSRGSIPTNPSAMNNPYNPYGAYNPYSPYNMNNIDLMRQGNMTPEQERLMRAMQAQRNAERQKQMLQDTQKLAALAADIQKDASTGGDLSKDSQKKAGEVEKLAKSVHDKMRGEN